MADGFKLQIYKGIISYLLEFTQYTLENIAELSCCSLQTVENIFYEDKLHLDIVSEIQLIKLYHAVLECRLYNKCYFRYKY